MRKRLHAFFTPRRILLFFSGQLALQIYMLMVVFPAIVPAPEIQPPDLRLHYIPEELYQFLTQIGSDGREAYRINEMFTDIAFPILYALAYAGLLIRLAGRLPHGGQWLWVGALLPFFIALADFGENLSIVGVINAYPGLNPGAANAAAMFSLVKHGLIALYLAALGSALSILAWTALAGKTNLRSAGSGD